MFQETLGSCSLSFKSQNNTPRCIQVYSCSSGATAYGEAYNLYWPRRYSTDSPRQICQAYIQLYNYRRSCVPDPIENKEAVYVRETIYIQALTSDDSLYVYVFGLISSDMLAVVATINGVTNHDLCSYGARYSVYF